MASLGEFRPPNQIDKDEDKYWKFTKIQLMYMTLGFMIGFLQFKLFIMLHITLFTIFSAIIWLILIAAGGFLGYVVVPDANYLKGGGLRLDYLLWRKIRKRFKKNRVIYARNIDDSSLYSMNNDRENPFIKQMKSLFTNIGG